MPKSMDKLSALLESAEQLEEAVKTAEAKAAASPAQAIPAGSRLPVDLDEVARLAGLGFPPVDMAIRLRISPKAFADLIARSEAVRDALRYGRVYSIDQILTSLYRAATTGDTNAAKFLMQVHIPGFGMKPERAGPEKVAGPVLQATVVYDGGERQKRLRGLAEAGVLDMPEMD